YSQTDTWLAGLAPVVGVYGISAVLLTSDGALVALLLGTPRTRWIAGAGLLLPWVIALPLRSAEWAHATRAPGEVAVVRGAVPQDQKWLDSNQESILATYRGLTERVLGTPVIVWPEAALPLTANELVGYLRELYRDASSRGSALVIGTVRASDDLRDYYNSVLVMGDRVAWYDKNHLVPFSEFFPVPQFVRDYLRLKSLPYADFTRGGDDQPPLPAGRLRLAA